MIDWSLSLSLVLVQSIVDVDHSLLGDVEVGYGLGHHLVRGRNQQVSVVR